MANTDLVKWEAAAEARRIAKERLKRKKAASPTLKSITPRLRSLRPRLQFGPPPPLPPPCEINESELQYLFAKQLKRSDVYNSKRIIVPKEYAEKYFPQVNHNKGLYLFMDDLAETKVWTFRFRYWTNRGSKQYVLECTDEYVKTYKLETGSYIMFYKNLQMGRFAVKSKKDEAITTSALPLVVHNPPMADSAVPSTPVKVNCGNQMPNSQIQAEDDHDRFEYSLDASQWEVLAEFIYEMVNS